MSLTIKRKQIVAASLAVALAAAMFVNWYYTRLRELQMSIFRRHS